MIRWLHSMFAALACTALVACGGDDNPAPPGNIVEVAQSSGLTALTAAASKAGLVTTLSAPGANLTVFAPTNAAFNTLATQLGFADANAMVQALPAPALANILTYHVLGSRKNSNELAAGGATQATLYTFSGAPATVGVAAAGGTLTFTDAALTTARTAQIDVPASNGIVHVVDKVLVPPGVLNLVQMAQVNSNFSTLVSAVVSANLQATLSGTGPFTVFAPTNAAFSAIASTVASLTPAQLTTVLTYHVVGGQVLSSQIPFGTPVTTVSGQNITINANPLRITDTTATPAPIVATDVRASNGVIHVLSKVLIPAL